MNVLREILSQYRPGRGLARELYHDPALYRAEMDIIWRRSWPFAGQGCQAPQPGDYFVYDMDGDSIIVVRREDGSIGALHNVCRHRGSIIATEPAGQTKWFVCPYHQWTYSLGGRLLTCRNMPPETDKSALWLRPVHVRNLEGLIYICLAADPPDFEAAANLMGPMARPQGFERARVVFSADYDVAANWKLVWENNPECYHCDVNHPQYIKANFDRYDPGTLSEEIERQI
jgi:phenylpropionate dioxygenase-like ring-hydroxylating dioxygenase large terminal subunit